MNYFPQASPAGGGGLNAPLSTGRALLLSVGGALAVLTGLFFAAALVAFLNYDRFLWEPPAVEDEMSLDEVMVMLEKEPPIAAVPPPQAERIRYLPTKGLESSATPPDPAVAKFLSDRNTRAGSEGEPVPGGVKGLPTQKGLEIPIIELVNRQFVDGEEKEDERLAAGIGSGAPNPATRPPLPTVPMAAPAPPEAPSPPVAAPPKPKILKEADPIPDPDSDLTANLPKPPDEKPKETAFREPKWEQIFPKEAPAKPADDKPKPSRPAPPDNPQTGSPGAPKGREKDALQIQSVKAKIDGSITTKGPGSVDAIDTPLGRYMEKVRNSVGKVFRPACMRHTDRISYGTVQVEFDINPKGVAENLRIANGGGTNAATQDLVLTVILQAKLPPIPPELSDYLIGNRLHITYGFIFH